jgi:hypothetical protein
MRIQKLSNTGFIFLLLLFVLPSRAEEIKSTGSGSNCSDSIVRPLNYSAIDFKAFYADRSLHYGREPLQVSGFWTRWLMRIFRLLGTVLSQKATPVIIYLVVFSTCAFILVRFLRGEAESAWQSNKENSLLFNEEGSQISGTDLNVLLQLEISSGNFNKAVRILFLQTIQQLANHGLISLHLEKTNSDFLHEIKDTRIRNQFRELTRIYEFLWYGNQAVDQSWFNRIVAQFHLFNDQING